MGKETKSKAEKQSHKDFLAGYATALGILQWGWREHDLVVKVLQEGGYGIDDLVEARIESYDLRLILEAHEHDGKLPPKYRRLLKKLRDAALA